MPPLGNVMRHNIRIFFAFLLLVTTTQTGATSSFSAVSIADQEQKIVKIHNAMKPASLKISLDDNLHGFIESKTCIFCKTIKVNITPSTKAYANNVKVPLAQAKNRRGQFATVIYELKTNNVSTIRW